MVSLLYGHHTGMTDISNLKNIAESKMEEDD
jgi:hypothetical protein